MKIYSLLLLHVSSYGFYLYMNSPYKNTNWKQLQFKLKERARNWFIDRATKNGIPWHELYEKNNHYFEEISIKKETVENRFLPYPDYYLKPFHGYDEGNLNWQAALEAEAATLSISAGYWDNVPVIDTQRWMRNNVTKHIEDYFICNNKECPSSILDVGCSIGISTEYLHTGFPESRISGLDLCPHFIGVAQHRAQRQHLPIHYFHANAENIPEKSGTYDLILCNFLFHEVPNCASKKILIELHRLLKRNGVLVIVDIDPIHLDKQFKNNVFRKWAFESTEPHIYDYYLRDTAHMMENAFFQDIVKKPNDPVNSIWIGTKGML